MPKFVPRQRKRKVLARQKAASTGHSRATPTEDSNSVQIDPLSKDEREQRRKKLRDELRAQQPKVSAKKQKRLDKYIENKLKRDENLDLVRKLEKEKDKWNASGLVSSKNLRKRDFNEFVNGQVNGMSSHEVVEIQQEAKRDTNERSPEDDTASEDSFEAENQDAFDDAAIPDPDETWTAKHAAPVQGSGLARPLHLGPDGLPIIPIKAGKRMVKRPETDTLEETDESGLEELSWEGFDAEEDGHSGLDDREDEYSSGMSDVSEDLGQDSDGNSDENVESEDETDSDTSVSSSSRDNGRIKPRTSAFKSWATQQLNQAIGHVPSYAADGQGDLPVSKDQNHLKPLTPLKEPITLVNGLPEVRTPTIDRRIYSVHVQRADPMQESRSHLPILQREQEIMEAVHSNSVVVIKGTTGSGKTTQLPQFLYEAGYGDPDGPTPGMIGITQPRRVAAVSMAKRVAEELGEHGGRVAHQIRFDSTVSSNTAIKFMTDGILLRELSQDLLLRKYSAIVIDEAHERSVNTDVLIGMLSKIVPARMKKDKFNPNPSPLKLIIMSATLNLEDFLHDKLFLPDLRPPIVEAEGRQHRVTTHFALRSRADYIEEVVEKVKRAHRKLPKGGILVFLTGQMEIKQVQNCLRKELVRSAGHALTSTSTTKMYIAASETPLEVEDIEFGSNEKPRDDLEDDEVDILTHSDEEAEEREFDISDDDEDTTTGKIQGSTARARNSDPYDTVHILPLYSQLPTNEQLKVFESPPERSRLIVLATNVAETSLTIPGIRYVFDSGRSKERRYNLDTGVQSFEIDYISKASAQQRAGRAGRTGPGHCWRLYTSAVYEQFFPDHTEPEILRAPAESIVLQIKGFAYPKPVVEFPFPTAPTPQTLNRAEKLLMNLGALTGAGRVTDLGRELSIYPLSPRLGKIVASAVKDVNVVRHTIHLVAGLAVGDIYINDAAALGRADDSESDVDEANHRKQEYGRAQATLSKHDKTSDVIKLLTVVSMYLETADKDTFCKQYFVKSKAMREIAQLIQQLRSIVSANHPRALPSSDSSISSTTAKLSAKSTKLVNSTAASGYLDQVAIRWDCHPTPPTLLGKPRRAIDVPYIPLVPLGRSSSSTDLVERAVFIHPSSVLSRLSAKDLPQYIVYTHLQQSQARTVTATTGNEPGTKTRMFPLTPIDAVSLARLARDSTLVEYGKPIPKTKVEDVSGAPRRRICWVSTELRGGGAGSFGWPLPASKVRQVMDVKSPTGWRVEEVLG